MPNLSVIVRTRNNNAIIEQSLAAIKNSYFTDYELIVVDDNSLDSTYSMIKRFTDNVIESKNENGRSGAYFKGVDHAKGEIIVNIDSDILVKPDALEIIYNYLSSHPGIDAITGLLSKEHANNNFFSQYKNLYMHYIFSKLPENVYFLYGGIHAIRRSAFLKADNSIEVADDTALGQRLISCGKKISFLKNLEVAHLKRYNIWSFIKNDFQIPFDWAKIFLKYKGWRQLFRNKTGYAHAPKKQLISLVLVPAIIFSSAYSIFFKNSYLYPYIFVSAWIILNFNFLVFLTREKGIAFGILSFFVTFFDNVIMIFSIISGFIAFYTEIE